MQRTSFLFIALSMLFAGCAGTTQIPSAWDAQRITVDGNDRDWAGVTIFELGDNLRASVCNDGVFLRLMLTTDNAEAKTHFLRGGLAVWFDPEGKDEKAFGIRYPARNERIAGMAPPEREQEAWQRTPSDARSRPEGGENIHRFFEMLNDGATEGVRVSMFEARGLLLRMSGRDELFVYEIQIPLRSGAEYPFGINPKDSIISIGFESVAFSSQGNRSRMGDGPGPGGPPPGGDMGGFGPPGGGPGGEMGGPPPGMQGRSETSTNVSVKQWMRIVLARQK
jgi:hypothetical protein